MKQTIALVLSIFFVFSLQAQSIDAEKSIANFSISNMKWNTVKGNFSGMKGTIKFDETDLANATFNVCMDAASVNTNSRKRDEHLRKPDFFDVEVYPEICFTSTSVRKTNDGFVTQGQMEMHGVTKEVDIPFTYQNGVFKGQISISRYDYKVGENTGTFMVGELVDIEIIAVVN